MTTGKVRVLETDLVVTSTNPVENDLAEDSEKQTLNQNKLAEATNRINVESRFARLKKSLRKKSVSIL